MITTKEKFKPDLLFVIPDTWKALVGGSHVQVQCGATKQVKTALVTW